MLTKVFLHDKCRDYPIDFLDSDRATVVEVEIPQGYYRVFSGAVKPTDKFLNLQAIKEGQVIWLYVDIEENMRLPKGPRNNASVFGCLIRKGTAVEEPCIRCQCQPKRPRHKYCIYCCDVLLNRMRGVK